MVRSQCSSSTRRNRDAVMPRGQNSLSSTNVSSGTPASFSTMHPSMIIPRSLYFGVPEA